MKDITRRKRIDACAYLMRNEKTPDWLKIYATIYRATLVIDMRTARIESLRIDQRRTEAALAKANERYDALITSEGNHMQNLRISNVSLVVQRISGARNYWDTTFIPKLQSIEAQMTDFENTITRYERTIANVNMSIDRMKVVQTRLSISNISDDQEVEDFFKDISEDFELTPLANLTATPGAHQEAFMKADKDATALSQAPLQAGEAGGNAQLDDFKLKLLQRMNIVLDGSAPAPPVGGIVEIPYAASSSRGRMPLAAGSSLIHTEFDDD
jgi:hypothetical protein